MHRGDFLTAVGPGKLESKLGDSRARFLGHDLQAFHDSRHDLMLDTGVKSFGVFPHDEQIDPLVTRLDAREDS